jgi:hypothetical protein
MAAADYTIKVQGTQLYMVRGLDAPVLVGGIMDADGLGGSAPEIPTGSWEDTEYMSRSGARTETTDFKFPLFLNPDDVVQRALKEIEGTDEVVEWQLIYPEGVKKTRTFDGYLLLFGDSAGDNNVYMGDVTIAVLTNEVIS